MIKKLFLNLWGCLQVHCQTLVKSLFAIAVIVQFIGFVPLIANYMDHRSIVEAHDNDAGKMVEVGLRTRWYNDNQFRYYGPLYFRIASTFHSIAPAYSGHYPMGSSEADEESIHFYLLLVSVLGFFLLAVSLSLLLTSKTELRLLSILFLTPALVSNPTWCQFIFMAHPDHLLTGLAAFSTYLTYRMIQENFSEKSLKWAAYAWGATLSTKLSALFFMPGLGLMFWYLSLDFKQTLDRWKRFTFGAMISYFLLGFPQSLDVLGSLKKLLTLSAFSSSFTWASFVNWWKEISEQSFSGIFIVLIISLIFSEKVRVKLNLKKSLIVFLILSLGLTLLTTRTLELAHAYYTMPFIGALLVGTVFLFQNLRFGNLIERIRTPIRLQGLLLLIFMLGSCFQLFSFRVAARTQAQMMNCRNEFRDVYQKTKEFVKTGHQLMSTPYTPVPLGDEAKVHIDWEMNFESLKKSQYDILVFNSSYYARYLEADTPTKYVQLTNPDWKATQEFYQSFSEKEEVSVPGSAVWKKIYKNKGCSLEIWQKN